MKPESEKSRGAEQALRAAFFSIAHELAPTSDAESIARAMDARGHWGVEAFTEACRSASVSARPVSGKLQAVFAGVDWALVELSGGGWVLARRQDQDSFAVYDVNAKEGSTTRTARELTALTTGRAFQLVAHSLARKAGETGAAHGENPPHWFWDVVSDYRASFVYIIIAGLVVNILALAMPLFIMNVYDRVFPNQAFATLWVLAFGVFAAIGFELVLKLTRAGLIDAVGRRVDYRVSTRLFEKILNAPLSERRESTGAYINRFNEFEFVRDFFTSSTVSALVDIGFVFIFFLIITLIAGWLVLVPIAGFILVLILGFALQHYSTKAVEENRVNSSARHDLLFETVAALESVKTLGAERAITKRWRFLVQAAARTNERMRRLTTAGMATSASIMQLITVGLIIGGAYLFAAGNLSLGAIIAVVMLSSRALAPVGTLALLVTRGRQAMGSLAALDRLMDLPSEVQAKAVSRPITDCKIEIKDVTVRFEDSQKPALKSINLTIKPGERVGLIGRVGSGKTTLCRMMAGLQLPDDGIFSIDGLDSRQYNIAEMRRAIRLVGADAELFTGSIRENLILADPAVSNEEIARAAELSGLLSFLSDGEAGFDRQIGERGSYLSNGQRRILALGRALVQPFRTLVLDEPTANLDTWTESKLIGRLEKAIEPKQTLIVSTHRQPVLQLVDRLIVLDEGEVKMDGPRDEVVAALQKGGGVDGAVSSRKKTTSGKIKSGQSRSSA